ncbi:phosphoribosylformylglycinamidine synthase subunit PurQ [Deltaproteobacteria bacterium OttesenSCG-928-M10]|nr:phosphoribosylformylglycinamidine synthase subunit PurQ [Deltaproteobacteria bacterium OttesenSCG-928-M10]
MTSPKTAVIVFPGSNCDRDCARGWEAVTGHKADFVWHKDSAMPDYDVVILPGGFSFGDYLRCGAIARYSPVMNEVIRLAERGSRILGICNGFQILCEAGLLPGALLRNRDLLFLCKDSYLKVENNRTDFTGGYAAGQVIRFPIAHGEGGFTINGRGLKELQDNGRIVLRYCRPDGTVEPDSAPNGSLDNIAGIINGRGNVMGLMPHPERLAEPVLGGDDGRIMLESIFKAVTSGGGFSK